MGKRERARRQAARADARASDAVTLSDATLPSEPSLGGAPEAQPAATGGPKAPSRRKNGRRGKGAPRRPRFDTTTWVIRGFVALTVALAIAFTLQSLGVFAPAPVDLATIEDVATQVKQNDPVGTRVMAQKGIHVPDSQKITTYSTNPPTSGSHWSAPTPWGIKDRQEPNERVVHNLEHGGVVISYTDLSEAELVNLKSLVGGLNKAGFRKIVVRPYPELKDARIALTAWGWISQVSEVDQKAILAFVKAHYEGKDAPEPKAP